MNIIKVRERYFPLLIVAVGLLAYCMTLYVPFVFDDEYNISDNPALRHFGALFSPEAANYFPRQRIVGYLSLAVNYQIHGLDVAGYHIVNISIHLVNALLVYLLVRLTFQTPAMTGAERRMPGMTPSVIALFAALLFVAHPVQTQAVTYVIQRLASLATFFYLLSLVAYIKARLVHADSCRGLPSQSAAYFALAALSAILGMYTKEIVFTLPLMALCYELLFFTGPLFRRIAGLVPLLLTLFIIPLNLLVNSGSSPRLISHVGEMARVMTPASRYDYLITQFRVIVTYLRLLVLPVGQRIDYDCPVYHSLLNPEVLASLLLLLSIAGCALLVLRRSILHHSEDYGWGRLVFFSVVWFFIALSVESSIIPIADVIFEHRLYLPSVGFCMLVPLLFSQWLPRKWIGLLSLLVVLAAGTTIGRNQLWRDDIRLWLDNEVKSPNKGRVSIQLGKACRKAGRDDLVVACYNRRLAIAPDDPDAYNNRGTAYYRMGRLEYALSDFTRAVHLDPGFALPYFNRGSLFLDLKEYHRALADLQRVEALAPTQDKLYSNLGYAYGEVGMYDRAIAAYTRELALRPSSGEVYYNRGIMYRRIGMQREAESDLTMAGGLGYKK